MKKVYVHGAFFNPDSPDSAGLITGLKKLIRRNFMIISDGMDLTFDSTLHKILRNEGIKLSTDQASKADYVITADNSNSQNIIVVSPKSRIKTFGDAVDELLRRLRSSERKRKTKETEIKIKVSLDAFMKADINTGVGFFDHMLEQIARHGNIGLTVKVEGDLHVDEHHTVEDTGITLGECLLEALGERIGIKRYGFFLPMDDSAAICAIDLGGRSYLNFKCKFSREKVGDFPTELTEEFFRGLASGLKANIYIRCKGKNDHHKIEAIFKAFAKALNEACRIDERSAGKLPSTKGVL